MTAPGHRLNWAAELVRSYGLPADTRTEPAGPGRHLLFRVDAPGAPPLFFKGTGEPPRDREEIEARLAFQAYLATRRGPAAQVVASTDGQDRLLFTHPSGAHGALYERLTGRRCAANPEDAAALGATLARLHDLADRWDSAETLPAAHRGSLLDRPAARMAKALGHSLDRQTSHLVQELGDWVDRLPRGPDVFGPCHGDSHHGNAAADGDGALRFFDFEHAMRCWRAYDLATFIWGCFQLDQAAGTWNAFIRGYGARRSLSQADADRIRPFLVIRQFWWLGFNAGVDGPLSAKMRELLEEGLTFTLRLAEDIDVRAILCTAKATA